MTFWPLGRAILVQQKDQGFLKPSLVFNLKEEVEFFRLLDEMQVPIRGTEPPL